MDTAAPTTPAVTSSRAALIPIHKVRLRMCWSSRRG
jgi:hypothetical protein